MYQKLVQHLRIDHIRLVLVLLFFLPPSLILWSCNLFPLPITLIFHSPSPISEISKHRLARSGLDFEVTDILSLKILQMRHHECEFPSPPPPAALAWTDKMLLDCCGCSGEENFGFFTECYTLAVTVALLCFFPTRNGFRLHSPHLPTV